MIRAKNDEQKEIVIDLTGPQGNAFFLIAQAKQYATQLQYTKKEIDKMICDLTAGDYEKLLKVFDKHFGEYVILER